VTCRPGALTEKSGSCKIRRFPGGAVAQLGERLNGIQEVASSILVSSTTEITPIYPDFPKSSSILALCSIKPS
jgi:hypothetical protein